MGNLGRVKGIYGGPVGKKLDIPVTRELLERLGKCLVDAFVREAKKDFAKRGWSGSARDESAPIWDSFSFKIRGERTIEVLSTFPDIDVLVSRDIPPRDLEWLTQEAKDANPNKYPLTKREQMKGAKKGNRMRTDPKTGEVRMFPKGYVPRSPLIVPLKSAGGTVVFRTAPLKTQDAWVHPGIARFTFAQRAVRAGKEGCLQIIRGEAIKALVAEVRG
jgi:hypothetical protein